MAGCHFHRTAAEGKRRFKPDPRSSSARTGQRARPRLQEARPEPREVLGAHGEGERRLVQALEEGARVERRRSRSGSSAARLNVSLQLPRPPPRRRRAQEQGRDHLGGRAGRHAHAHLPASCTARSASSPTCCKTLGVEKGDRVTIYMPMIPEAAIAMLACARIGATHSVIFGGFSAEAVADRINDAQAQARHHRRRRLAARQGRAAEGQRRRGARAERRRSRTSSSSSAPATRSRCRRAATSGGTS